MLIEHHLDGIISPMLNPKPNLAYTRREKESRSVYFRDTLMKDGINLMFQGKMVEGKRVLATYIKLTIGYKKLSERMGISVRTLRDMFSKNSNPRLNNMMKVLQILQDFEETQLMVDSNRADLNRRISNRAIMRSSYSN